MCFCEIQRQELADLEYGKAGCVYMTSNIEGRDVHNAFWRNTETIQVDGMFIVKIFSLIYSFGVYPVTAGICVLYGQWQDCRVTF